LLKDKVESREERGYNRFCKALQWFVKQNPALVKTDELIASLLLNLQQHETVAPVRFLPYSGFLVAMVVLDSFMRSIENCEAADKWEPRLSQQKIRNCRRRDLS